MRASILFAILAGLAWGAGGYFEKAGLNYVSCSPYRIPVARLAAAQAALQQKALD